MAQLKSNLYILKVLFIFLLILLIIILMHLFCVLISWFIPIIYFNNSPIVAVCCCRCCFLSLCATSDLQNDIVLYSTASTYDNFKTGFGTVTVGRKCDNRVHRLHVPHIYKYPLTMCFPLLE